MNSIKVTTFLAVATLAACTGKVDSPGDGDGDGDGDADLCQDVEARSYIGLGGGALEADRVDAREYSDRMRLKPFVALAAEYRRVLGLDVATAPYADTFGSDPARWWEEPSASGNALYAAYSIAYDGCTSLAATDAVYAEAPSAANAEGVCADLARRFWDREPSADEVSSCAGFAVSSTRADQSPRERWAYTCAAVLSAAGFLSY